MTENAVIATKFVGFTLQLIGILILISTNTLFYRRARKRFGSAKKAFVDFAGAHFAYSQEELKKANDAEALRQFLFAEYLYGNYRNSLIGITVTTIGVVVAFVGLLT